MILGMDPTIALSQLTTGKMPQKRKMPQLFKSPLYVTFISNQTKSFISIIQDRFVNFY